MREETLRADADVAATAQDLVEALTGDPTDRAVAGDLVESMPAHKVPKYPYIRKADLKARRRARVKQLKAEAKLCTEETRYAALRLKLLAGNPSAPQYNKRLASAKKVVRLAEALPVIARQKWANPAFREEMEAKGFNYDVSAYRGWLPYEDAKAMQQKLIGAKSRGEYEFFVKLFCLRFLPARPDRTYGVEWSDEWTGWPDFLGVMNVFGQALHDSIATTNYRSFYDALTVSRTLKCKNIREWRTACKEGRVPIDIPIDPHRVYPEFISVEHWLGTDSALDVVMKKASIQEVWVLYTDGREDAFWWAKMTTDKYGTFASTDGITIERVYEFEGNLAGEVWAILDQFSEMYAEDKRERYVGRQERFSHIRSELDGILKWKNPA